MTDFNKNTQVPQCVQTVVSDSYVWAFLYCNCIHESSFATVSLHKTEKGAEMAMEFHKENERKEHEELYANFSDEERKDVYVEFGLIEAWDVQRFPLLL